jgi:hypothetical protein
MKNSSEHCLIITEYYNFSLNGTGIQVTSNIQKHTKDIS